jgi:hypothetical protein
MECMNLTESITLRITPEQAEALERLRRLEHDIPQRAEVLRRLIDRADMAARDPGSQASAGTESQPASQ